MYSLAFVAHSEVGKVRKNNQDSGYASPNLLLVADGMGGAAAGDLASAVAVAELSKADERLDSEAMLEAISGSLSQANDRIADLVAADPLLDGMGTTVCGALFSGTQLGLIHIGDSRGYLLRDGKLTRLTHDHSWVQSLIDEGKITPEQAETHPHRSLLLKVLNGQPHHEPDIELLDVQEGDRLLFCSDGLCGLVHDHDLAELAATPDRDEAVAALTAAANAAGGIDNITVVLADVVPASDELDSVSPVTVGSAEHREIPDAPHATGSFPPVSSSPADDDGEAARYAPAAHRSRWLGTTLIVLACLTLASLGAWGAISYARTKYFVGAADEQLAIYQGIPGNLLGIRLNELRELDDTRVTDLPRFYQESVQRGITVADLAAAKATLGELRLKANHCIEVRKQRTQTSTPTPTPPTEASPDATATASPYPNQPVNPEEC